MFRHCYHLQYCVISLSVLIEILYYIYGIVCENDTGPIFVHIVIFVLAWLLFSPALIVGCW